MDFSGLGTFRDNWWCSTFYSGAVLGSFAVDIWQLLSACKPGADLPRESSDRPELFASASVSTSL